MFLPTTEKSSLSPTGEETIYTWPSISVWDMEQHLKWGAAFPSTASQRAQAALPYLCDSGCRCADESLGKTLPECRWWLENPQADVCCSHPPQIPVLTCIPPGALLLHQLHHSLCKCNPSPPATLCHLLPPSMSHSLSCAALFSSFSSPLFSSLLPLMHGRRVPS